MSNIITRNLERRKKYHREFKMMFGINLSHYFDNLVGFDVIAFDDFVKPADGESTSQAVEKKWGKDAVTLISNLIGSSDGET